MLIALNASHVLQDLQKRIKDNMNKICKKFFTFYGKNVAKKLKKKIKIGLNFRTKCYFFNKF